MATEERTANFYTCGCGWKRDVSISLTWRRKVITHPRYGRVTNLQAAQWDVFFHDCGTYILAYGRAPRANAERVRDYSKGEDAA